MTVGAGLVFVEIFAAAFWFAALLLGWVIVLSLAGGSESRLAKVIAGVFVAGGALWILWAPGPGRLIAERQCTDTVDVAADTRLPISAEGVALPPSVQPSGRPVGSHYYSHGDVLYAEESNVVELLSRGVAYVDASSRAIPKLDIPWREQSDLVRYKRIELAECNHAAGVTVATKEGTPMCIAKTRVESSAPFEYVHRYDRSGHYFGLGLYEYIRYELIDRRSSKVVASTFDFTYSKAGIGGATYCANARAFRQLSSASTLRGAQH